MKLEEMRAIGKKCDTLLKYQEIMADIYEIINKSRLAKIKKQTLKDLIHDLLIIQSQIDTF